MTGHSSMVNGFDPSTTSSLEPGLRRLVERRAKVLSPAYRLFYEHPVSFVRAQGVHLFDEAGVAYLDAYNNVPSVGHCHPRVVEAVSRQMAILNTHTRYATADILDYSERLLATLPPELSTMTYTCSGSEAVDVALRIASSHTGATGVIVTRNAYHGTTGIVSQISPSLGDPALVGNHVRTVALPSGPLSAPEYGRQLADSVNAAIDSLRLSGVELSAFIADSLLSSDGIIPDPAGFWAPVISAVHAAGGLYIADEVQPGFARTGEAMWGFLRHVIVPDLVVMGKPMGNGLPIAGVAARPEVAVEFGASARYFNTFAANSVCVAAATAVLDVIDDEQLMANSREVGRYLKTEIARLARSHPAVGDVRGVGLYVGVDVISAPTGQPDPVGAAVVVNALRERHILISATGPHANVLKIRPPLTFSRDDSDRLLEGLVQSLTQLTH